MSASRIFHLSNQLYHASILNLGRMCYASSMVSRHTMFVQKNTHFPLYTRKRQITTVIVRAAYEYIKNLILQANKIKVHILPDYFKGHEKIQRDGLVRELSTAVKRIKGKETKVVYILGLPGTGKKELAKQYAKWQYKNKKIGNYFVAAIDVSDPNSFHQDLFKIAENTNVIENYEQYEVKTAKTGGYKDVLLKISSCLNGCSNWVLVLNGLKFNDLHWRVGGETNNTNEINQALQNLDLNDCLPLPGAPNHGTILITTCDGIAKTHKDKNVETFDMPKGMTDEEALKLLAAASGIDYQKLLLCEPAKKVIRALDNVPTSVYW